MRSNCWAGLGVLALTALPVAVLPASAQGATAAAATTTAVVETAVTTAPRDGRIAYVRDGNLWAVRPDGSGAKRLTATGRDSQPRWSKDGTQLAFLRSTGGTVDIWTSGADGSGARQVTTVGGTGRPDWSPDGTTLAFTARLSATARALYHVDVRGGTPLPFYGSTGGDGSPGSDTPGPAVGTGPASWSADGTRIAFLSGPNQGCGGGQSPCVWELVLRTQLIGEIATSYGDPGLSDYFLSVDYAPDSRHAAITERNVSGTTPPVVYLGTQFAAPYVRPAHDGVFSPLGTRAAVARAVGGVQHVYIVKSDGTVVRDLTAGDTPDWQPLP